jgi:hypothetical protein
MKTVEEFIKEIEKSEALKAELKAVKNDDELAAFLKKNDCGASVKEYLEYADSLNEGEIGDDEAEAAAGGGRTGPQKPTSPYTPGYRSPKR